MKTKNTPAKEKTAVKANIKKPAAVTTITDSSERIKGKNEVILTGNLGVNPTIHELKNGGKKAFFTMATNLIYSSKAGALKEETMWHSLVAWGKLADKIADFKIGDRVNVTGRINHRNYTDASGISKLFTEIVLNSIEAAEPKVLA